MQIQALPLGPLGANCYIVSDPDAGVCAVVDPGGAGGELALRLERSGLRVAAVFLTHGHFDHVGGAAALREATGAPVYLSGADRALPPDLTGGPLPETADLREGDAHTVGAVTFRVLATPGHSAGSVCLTVDDGEHRALLTGDTLFAGSCGRTDFPGGSTDALMASLARLSALEGNWPVLPGYGPASTLEEERRSNPFLRQAAAGEAQP